MRALEALRFAACVSLFGCTLTSDFDIHQCRSDEECSGYAEARICQAERCVPGCESNAQCSALDPGKQLCPSYGAQCVSLESNGGECFLGLEYDARSMGSLRGEDLTLLGVFAAAEPVESPAWEAYQLAARELNALGGLPGPTGPRPVLLAVCDAATEQVPGGVAHLLDTLHARAIVASVEREAFVAALESARSAPDLLILAPRAGLVQGPGAESVWRIPDNPIAASAYAALIRQLALGQRPLRVASLTSEGDDDRQLAVAAAQAFGGAEARSLSASANFVLPDHDPVARLEVLARLRAFAPDLVLVFASGFFALPVAAPRLDVLGELERAWPKGVARPRYLLSPRNEGEELGALASDPSFAERVLALAARRSAPAPFEPALPFAGAGQREDLLRSYDASYFLAYALAASTWTDAREAGGAGRSLEQLVAPQPEVVDVGPGELGLQKGVALLEANVPFQLRPTTELPTLDPMAAARPLSLHIYCPAASAGAEPAAAAGDSLSYDPSAAAFEAASSALPACLEEPFGGPLR